jgi:hypothetical protein
MPRWCGIGAFSIRPRPGTGLGGCRCSRNRDCQSP